MENYVYGIISTLVGAGIIALVALVVNGLRNEIHEMKEMLRGMVSETLCKERREGMKRDIDNIGDLVRGK